MVVEEIIPALQRGEGLLSLEFKDTLFYTSVKTDNRRYVFGRNRPIPVQKPIA